MVHLLPPQLAGDNPSYLQAYNGILSAHRRSPLASASSVIMLVAPDVDALCAARMLAMLFKQDDVGYRIIPVCITDSIVTLAEQLLDFPDLQTLLLINVGNILDLARPDWLGGLDLKVTIHVIDSARPISLTNLFMGGDNGNRVVIWDDDDSSAKLAEEKKAWEILEYEPEPAPDDDRESEYSDEEDLFEEDDQDDPPSETGSPNKRKKSSRNGVRKRRRLDEDNPSISIGEWEQCQKKIDKYYTTGAWFGQSAASTVYILATLLERVDNDFLWFGILGLTFQYITSRISRNTYESYHSVYFDEVSRLNPQPTSNDALHSLASVNPDDTGVRTSEELRFMLFRHWTLYDAMFHSNYVSGRLGIWKEKGRQKFMSLLAKMGFSIPQTQQPYSHMDMELKKDLIQKLGDIAPEYGLVELSYPSFIRCYGFHTQPLSAADAVEGLRALLDVAGGMRMEVEIEGMRNGGEWFGGGRIWDSNRSGKRSTASETENPAKLHGDEDPVAGVDEEREKEEWWIKNFWTAYDSLSDISLLRESLNLAMSLQRAIIRQGTSIIDKQDIRTMRNHRVVILQQGPDLALFSHPGVLGRLAAWLVDALRDRMPATAVGKSKKKSLPFVIACLDEARGQYTVVGIIGALDFDQVRRNEFVYTFVKAADACNAEAEYASFETNIMRIAQKDLKLFLEQLCM
ncbi:CDC45-like protein [Pholiota conissans]|uniref:CDC45-like protein n=1 Tax=Pholiota conissans TaxID=109636 RepID=A0A9P6CXA3_9AGAR|nr:CDC45-like protein [Pholiota conissans]